MALTPTDEDHALQIQAGVLGRKAGHAFEDQITEEINSISYPVSFEQRETAHVTTGAPAIALLSQIAAVYGVASIRSATAISTGALATSEDGQKWLRVNGVQVKRCKSDLIINAEIGEEDEEVTIGVSTKQCNNKTPTNAQLFFTTARGFAKLLRDNGIAVSDTAVDALRQFCGDVEFRPLDSPQALAGRLSDPRRYFWEEIDSAGRIEWENLLCSRQSDVTRLLLQKAYLEDPFSPDMLLHKTRRAASWAATETAIYSIDELISHSMAYSGFWTKPYSVRKGSYKNPPGTSHLAPRFGVVQMQRGGQQQHPDQLQFNLEAGYFYKIGQNR